MTESNAANDSGPRADANASREPPGSAPRPARSRWRTVLLVLVVGYALGIVGLWLWMIWQGGRDTVATLILFGPRWLCGLPLPVLALASLIWHRRLLWVLAVAGAVLVFPFMGFQVHWPAARSTPVRLRVMTCNVDQDVVDAAALAELVRAEEPDVVALQEVNRRTRFVWPDGWYVLNNDEFSVASRWPIREEQALEHPLSPPEKVAISFRVELPTGVVRLVNLHLRSPRPGIEAVLKRGPVDGDPALARMLEILSIESQQTSDWVAQLAGPKIVAGDFNMPSQGFVYRRDWRRLDDAFGQAGFGFGFTKISSRGWMAYGSRIDHVLYDDTLRCVRAWVGPDVGSDHLPLFAEFQ